MTWWSSTDLFERVIQTPGLSLSLIDYLVTY
jgi:hypothetical protein